MGIFGGQIKPPVEIQPAVEPEEEPIDNLPELPEPRNITNIASGITVAGSLLGEGIVQVEGVVDGEAKVTGSVTVTVSGLVKGPIEANVVRIAGRVEGSVLAHDHLRLEKTGTIDGDVASYSFVIEDGGRLNGRCTMTGLKQDPTRVPADDPASRADN